MGRSGVKKDTRPTARARPRARARVGASRTPVTAARIRRTRPPDAPGIMVALNAEHRHIASLLDALSRESDRLLPGRDPDLPMIRDIVRYLNDFPDQYHHPREDLLFGILERRDPGSREPIGRLQEGHRDIYRRSRELLDVMDEGARTGDHEGRRRLKYLCDRYIGFYRDHIDLEEGVVFPRATEKLRRADWAEVNDGSRQVDDPLFGERVRKEYRRLSLYLATRVERVGEELAIAEVFGVEALVEGVVAAAGAAVEVKGIVEQRLRGLVSECIAVAGQPARNLDAVLLIPLAIAGSVRNHADAGMQEVSAVLDRARGELRDAVSVRLGHLRKLLR